jgi:transposase
MPRQARLFDSCSGSAVRGFTKFRGNITPRWIANAHTSRKRLEPAINKLFRELRKLRKSRPHAKVTIRNTERELRTLLKQWETAYRKESFYRGIRVLLEVQREGSSIL